MIIDDFLIRAALAGIGVALAAGPLGCFVLWRRMAYFGDATAHAAILGVAIALALEISVTAGVLAAAIAVALWSSSATEGHLSQDSRLGVIAHAGLALGVLAIALTGKRNVDLEAYLFGEILAVNTADLAVIWGGGALILALIWWRWAALLASTISADMAAASELRAVREHRLLTLALAILVAVAIKVVGALLITALLIIPAAAARPLARTPEAMAALACAIGVASAILGLLAALQWDLPAGPSIVTAATVFFLLASGLSRRA